MKTGSFWASNIVQEISKWGDRHQLLLMGLFTIILLPLIPKAWNDASNRFEAKYKMLLLTIATLLILTIISFLLYFLLVISPRDYPTAR
jgi:phosphatidylglycerophosphate synthase